MKFKISIEGAGNGSRTAHGKDVRGAFESLGYKNFDVTKDSGSEAILQTKGAIGHQTKYYATTLEGVHNGCNFCEDEIKEGDLAINIEGKKSEAMQVSKLENGTLGFHTNGWFAWIPLRKSHRKVLE